MDRRVQIWAFRYPTAEMPDVRCILRTSRRAFFFTVLPSPDSVALPFNGEPFPCVLWDASSSATPDQRFALADALIAAGCRYLVCGGHGAEDWELGADEAFVMRYLDVSADVSDPAHVMKTAHDGETESEVVYWLVNNTNFDHHDFTKLLIVQVALTRRSSSGCAMRCVSKGTTR